MTNIENLNKENGSGMINVSDPATIRNYFLKVRELRKSGNEFPVNLDDVFPLVYSERGKAVRSLKGNFLEDVDFKVFAQNGKNLNGRPKTEFYLSVPAMEFFVAKKVKEVFNVYREVFHKSIDEKEKPLSQAELLLQSAQLLLEQDRRISVIENKVDMIEAKTTTRPDYFSVMGFAVLNKITVGLTLASTIGRKAASICRKNNLPTDEVPDPRFGKVKLYPKNVLEDVFNQTVFA